MNALLALVVVAAAPLEPLALPGGPPVDMDYLAFDAATGRLWVPAGNTGKVEVITVATGALTSLDGFPTSERKGRVLGPSSATIGEGFVYVGNRGASTVCAIDSRSLERAGCVTLPSPPDGVAFVSTTHEVWVTTPGDASITVLDVKQAAAPKLSSRIPVEEPEGYAVDPAHGLFFTNQEEGDRTLAFDVKTHRRVATWEPGCGGRGPRGLAFDAARRHLFVACNAGSVKVLDAAHDGKLLGQAATGEGLDNIDFDARRRLVFAAAGRAGTLSVLAVSDAGALTVRTTVPTAPGVRVVVLDGAGVAWLADSKGGRLLSLRTIDGP